MSVAHFRFYAELNDFLPGARRSMSFAHSFVGAPSVKDAIESLGVPHAEIELVLVNSESVDFSYRLRDGDRVSVYPIFEAFDITPLLRVRPEPLREPRFVLDCHLGRLAAYLRLCGFDTLWRNDFHDEQLARLSVDERRILLTRDVGLLKRSKVAHGHWMRETRPNRQLAEVLRRFDLRSRIAPFTRCLRCNTLLSPVETADIADRLSPRTRAEFNHFRRCRSCDRIYWAGSHVRHMQRLLNQVLGANDEPA